MPKNENIIKNKSDINSNKNINFLQLAIFFITSIILFFFITQNSKLFKKINELESFNKELLSNITSTTENDMTKLFEKISLQAQNELNTNMQELKKTTQKNFNGSLANITKKLDTSINSTIELANSKIIRNEKNADLALEMAEKYIKANNYALAKIYLINAINHNPQKIKYIDRLFQLFQNHYSSNDNVLNQIRSIIELSLYQLEPQDIDKNFKYLSVLNDAEKKIILKSKETNKKEEIDWDAEYSLLIGQDLNDISTDPDELSNRLKKLNNILSNIKNNDTKYGALINSVKEEMDKEQKIYSLSTVAQEVNHYIALLADETDYSSQLATSRLIAASKSMSVFWAYDINELPMKLRYLIGTELPDRIKSYKQKINTAKSLPFYEKANKIITETTRYRAEKYQNMIDHTQKSIEEITLLLQNINDPKFQKEIYEGIKNLREQNVSYQREQYIAYQKWAAGICSDVFDKIENTTLLTTLFDDDAKRIFNQSLIDTIDLRLTSPEVSQVYNKIIQKITGRLPSKDAFKIQKDIMLSQKETLGDF